MKVAYATTDGVHVDEHFGRAGTFALYEFTKEGFAKLAPLVFSEGRDEAVESTRGMGAPHELAVEDKVEKLSGCGIVYMTAIGGPSAARMSRKGMMPVKVPEGAVIEELAEGLMRTINTAAPPWLRKLLA